MATNPRQCAQPSREHCLVDTIDTDGSVILIVGGSTSYQIRIHACRLCDESEWFVYQIGMAAARDRAQRQVNGDCRPRAGPLVVDLRAQIRDADAFRSILRVLALNDRPGGLEGVTMNGAGLLAVARLATVLRLNRNRNFLALRWWPPATAPNTRPAPMTRDSYCFLEAAYLLGHAAMFDQLSQRAIWSYGDNLWNLPDPASWTDPTTRVIMCALGARRNVVMQEIGQVIEAVRASNNNCDKCNQRAQDFSATLLRQHVNGLSIQEYSSLFDPDEARAYGKAKTREHNWECHRYLPRWQQATDYFDEVDRIRSGARLTVGDIDRAAPLIRLLEREVQCSFAWHIIHTWRP